MMELKEKIRRPKIEAFKNNKSKKKLSWKTHPKTYKNTFTKNQN